MGSRLVIATTLLMFAIGLLSACAQNPSAGGADPSADRADTQGNAEQPSEEPTVYPKQVLTGIITKSGEGQFLFDDKPGSWILVEKDPTAGCRSNKAPMGPCSPKMYFDMTSKSDVYRESGNSLVKVSAARLKSGQRVRADYTGYDVAESYPSQTDAREVVILKTN